MNIHGKNLIGAELSASGHKTFLSYDPRSGSSSGIEFHEAESAEIEKAAELAAVAAVRLQELSAEEIANFLDAIREEILALGDELIETADRETALGLDRLRGERERTVNQIKFFADIAREGSWVDARIDTPQPERKPVPKPDLRRMLQPIGPVAVFGASNFPLAFSIAGGDTASIFAARNPVIVKAHPAHPATSELVGGAIASAVKKRSLPGGTFSLLHGLSPEASLALVNHHVIKAVAFTGSLRAGRALFDAAAKRHEPIPVFAEMGSVNPVFLLPSVLAKNAASAAEGMYRSVTLGVGQYCTCPGLIFGSKSAGLDSFVDSLGKQFAAGTPATMLNASIAKGYAEAFDKIAKTPGVQVTTSKEAAPGSAEGRPGLIVSDVKTWLGNSELREEVFGPSTVIIRCDSEAEELECARNLEGSLTATVHGTPDELAQRKELLGILQRKAGRLLFNSYPTGLEVAYATQHGGPYPASTDSRFTSVGAAAIYRFARPVCYQNFPDAVLPAELQSANPRGIWRMLDGKLTQEALKQP